MKTDVRMDGVSRRLEWQKEGTGYRFAMEADGGGAAGGLGEVLAVEAGIYSVLVGDRSYEVKIVPGPEGSWFVDLDGRHFAVELRDPRESRGAAHGRAGEGRYTLKSAMPGKVVRVLAAVGDEVEAGQGIVVVEAMKMQNEVKTQRAGKVVQVMTVAGATVAAGEALAVVE